VPKSTPGGFSVFLSDADPCPESKICEKPDHDFFSILAVAGRDDHYLVCPLDIRQDSEFATGYGHSKTAFKREPDTDKDIQNNFLDISRIQTLEKNVAHCTIIHFVSLKTSFQPSVPSLQVCLAWCNLSTVV